MVRGVTYEVGLQFLRFMRLQPFQVPDAGLDGVLHMLAQAVRFLGAAGHDQFAEAAIRDTVVRAIGVEEIGSARK